MRKIAQCVLVLFVVAFAAADVQAQSCPSGAPTLVYPPNNANNIPRDAGNSVTVKWNAVANATSYDVYFGPQGSGCSSSPRATVTGTTFSPPSNEIVGGGAYEWKVVAKGSIGCPTVPASTCAKFTMVNCPSSAPVLTQPANNSTVPFGLVTLKWQSVANAAFYEVFVSVDGGTPTLAGVTTGTERTISAEAGRTIQWVVRASATGCGGFVSPVSTFETTCPATLPKLATPSNNATFPEGTSILFTWTDIDGAAGSVLEYSQNGGNTWQALGERTSGRSRQSTFAPGTWLWRIRTEYAGDCPDLISAASSFRVVSTACNNNAPALVSPADGSSHTLPVTLGWTSPANATQFLVFASGPNGAQQIGATAGNTLAVTNLAPGTYQWYVVAKFPNCPDVESSRRSITIRRAECPAETITLTSPINGATIGSPANLAWTPIANAVAYRIWGSQDGGAPVLVTRTTAISASVNLPAGFFRWKVEGLRADCDSVLSPEGSFVVQAATNCGSNLAPELLPPTVKDDPAAERKGNTVVLPWIAQTRGGTLFYRVWIALAGQPFEDIGVTRETQLERELPAGKYRWFVQQFFEGCGPLSSPIEQFTVEDTTGRCSDAKPILAEPVNGATVDRLRFRVTEIDSDNRNVRYRFFAIVDRANGQSETVLLGSSTKPEFEPALQPPPGTYQAFVEKSVDECPSTFSDRVTFTIARGENCNNTPVQLQSPANGAQNLPPDIDFIWVPQGSPAVGYILFLQVNDDAPTAVASTRETRITHRVPPGRIRWWVVGLVPGCDPTISERFTFTVALPEACAINPPVPLQPDLVEEVSDRGVPFAWSRVRGATRYNVWVWPEGDAPAKVATTTEQRTFINLPAGSFNWLIEAETQNCGTIRSATSDLRVVAGEACGVPGKPRAHVVGRTMSGTEYRVRWSGLANVNSWELQESLTSDFANPQTFLLTDTEYATTKTIPTGTAQFHYRVRGLSDCNDERGAYSDVVKVLVIAPQTRDASVEIGATSDVVQQILIPGSATPVNFTVTVDKPWVSASPSSGVLGPQGATITLTSKRDELRLGGNRATIKVTTETPSSGVWKSHAVSVVSIPISVSIVTPVTPSGKSAPPPDALIFSGVGHGPGQNNSLFQSDVRITNLSAQTMKYQVNYTPTGTDGTVTGNSTTVEVAPNQTLALDDIVATVFGATTSSGSLGMLEVRPLTTSSMSSGSLFSTVSSTAQQLLTLGSSRTYNFTATGTFGQFVPAIPFAKFVGSGKILSLQQVTQTDAFRANFGFLEASGQPVNLSIRAYDAAGGLLQTITESLLASEHKHIGLLLHSHGITNLEDGRVEVEVTGGGGKISAYVSEVDNLTNDPLLVTAVEKGAATANRFIVPGMAHKDLGFAFWVSDLRIFNAGTTQVPATLTFFKEAEPSTFVSKQVTIDPGEIEVLNDVVQNLFGQPNGAGGSVVITTPSNVPLDVTSKTYNRTTTGTYGQFIPGFTVADSIGVADRAQHILQIEHSDRFRTNIALTETTGNPAKVEVSLILPDSIATPVVTYDLAGNEFRQFSISDFQIPDAIYNARISVKVVEGTGKVTAFGSLIDMGTNDPTNIPPQY